MMKLDLKNMWNDVDETGNPSILKSIDSLDTSEASAPAKYMYLIVDGSGLHLDEMEEEVLTDRSAVLLAALQSIFADDDSRFQQLCDLNSGGLEETGRTLTSWMSDNLDKLNERFAYLEGMCPYTPTDMVNTGDVFLIEMTYMPEEE